MAWIFRIYNQTWLKPFNQTRKHRKTKCWYIEQDKVSIIPATSSIPGIWRPHLGRTNHTESLVDVKTCQSLTQKRKFGKQKFHDSLNNHAISIFIPFKSLRGPRSPIKKAEVNMLNSKHRSGRFSSPNSPFEGPYITVYSPSKGLT